MGTETYPEVSGDESGIVPPQSSTRPSEWPKKLRTLTAAELDRLTIDSSGRFYWDSKLVNYDTGAKQLTDKSADPLDHSMDIIDRAAYELGGHRRNEAATIEGELAALELPAPRTPSVDLDTVRAEIATAIANAAPAPQLVTTIEQTGLTLSRGQIIATALVILCMAIGAIGVATYGYVAAVEWGCKTSPAKAGCPAPAAAPARADIPA